MSSDEGSLALKRQRAYREANQHVVAAGIQLAAMGVPKDAPEMQALRAALRAVNAAGGIERPMPQSRAGGAGTQVPVRKEAFRVYPPAPGLRPGRPGGAA